MQTNTLKLYELADQYRFLLDSICDETGAVDETALANLQALSDPIEEKCINVVRAFKSLASECKAVSEERQAMAKRERALKNRVDQLREYLRTNMEQCKINEIKCPQFVIKLVKNNQSVDAFDKTLIPSEYKKVTIELDVHKMNEDMKNGVYIPGARLVQKMSIRIS